MQFTKGEIELARRCNDLKRQNAALLAALEELIDEAWQYDEDAETDLNWTFSNSTRDRLLGAISAAKRLSY